MSFTNTSFSANFNRKTVNRKKTAKSRKIAFFPSIKPKTFKFFLIKNILKTFFSLNKINKFILNLNKKVYGFKFKFFYKLYSCKVIKLFLSKAIISEESAIFIFAYLARKFKLLNLYSRRIFFNLTCAISNKKNSYELVYFRSQSISLNYFVKRYFNYLIKIVILHFDNKKADLILTSFLYVESNLFSKSSRDVFRLNFKGFSSKTYNLTTRPAAGKFSYLGSYNSKTFYNRERLWTLSTNYLSRLSRFSFSSIFNFGLYYGLNFDKIGFWQSGYSSAAIWRAPSGKPFFDLYYKPARGSWRKGLKKKNPKSFLPLQKYSFYSTPSSFNFLQPAKYHFNDRDYKIFFKKVNILFKKYFLSNSFNFFNFNAAVKKLIFNLTSSNEKIDLGLVKKNFKNYDATSIISNLGLNQTRIENFSINPASCFGDFLSFNKNGASRFNRFFDLDGDFMFKKESFFLDEFVLNKKNIFGLVVTDRNDSRETFIKSSSKFYYYYSRNDALTGSYFLDKVISVFACRWNKKKVKNAFYKLFFDANSEFSIEMLYGIIDSLKPTYINVKVRRGREFYEAPILASESKSILKAIKFFKKAVINRRQGESFFEKLRGEIYDFFCWDGYANEYYENYAALSKKNMHLRHFRSATKY